MPKNPIKHCNGTGIHDGHHRRFRLTAALLWVCGVCGDQAHA